MKIPIKVSDLMDEKSRYTGSLEDRSIRVPLELRRECNIKLSDFINLKSINGDLIALKVSMSYIDDAEADSMTAYVTRNVFDALNLDDIKGGHNQEVLLFDGMTLGCDPELFLVNGNTHDIVSPKVICKAKYGQVGHDGYMLEVRPLPSPSEVVVVKNLWTCLSRAREMLNKSKKVDGNNTLMCAMSHYRNITAGFHIHFGIPNELKGGLKYGKRWSVNNQIARVLDYYVGIPAIIPEGEDDCTRRTSLDIEYGKPGEWRQEAATFEYRVPGGNLLRHPTLAMGIIGLGAIVMEDALSRISMCTDGFKNLGVIKSVKDIQEIYPNVPEMLDVSKIICSRSVKPAINLLDTIVDDVESMVGFERRRNSIEQMVKCLRGGHTFSPYVDINWRLQNEKQQRSMDVSSA